MQLKLRRADKGWAYRDYITDVDMVAPILLRGDNLYHRDGKQLPIVPSDGSRLELFIDQRQHEQKAVLFQCKRRFHDGQIETLYIVYPQEAYLLNDWADTIEKLTFF